MFNKNIHIVLAILFIFFFTMALNIPACRAIDCSNVNQAGQPVKLCNPLGSGDDKADVPKFLGQIINYALGIIGSLALVMIIYGGATWMLSAGSQERVSKGKSIIIWAALGLIIIFTAYALVRFVITAIAISPAGP